MSGERLARVVLALDAVYCAALGLLAIALRGRIGALVGLPGVVIGMIGTGVIGWAYVVLGQTVRIDWRRGVKQTIAANTVASVLLALGAAFHPGRGASAVMALTSLKVMALAAAQTLSLIRGRSRE